MHSWATRPARSLGFRVFRPGGMGWTGGWVGEHTPKHWNLQPFCLSDSKLERTSLCRSLKPFTSLSGPALVFKIDSPSALIYLAAQQPCGSYGADLRLRPQAHLRAQHRPRADGLPAAARGHREKGGF